MGTPFASKEKYKGSFILSADTIVYSRRKILNKTFDEKEALNNIKSGHFSNLHKRGFPNEEGL